MCSPVCESRSKSGFLKKRFYFRVLSKSAIQYYAVHLSLMKNSTQFLPPSELAKDPLPSYRVFINSFQQTCAAERSSLNSLHRECYFLPESTQYTPS